MVHGQQRWACSLQPTTSERYLLFGSDREATRSQFIKFFSLEDWRADCRMQVRLDVLPVPVQMLSGSSCNL
jgi:hypothetical protein